MRATANKIALAAAFTEWLRRYKKDPKAFAADYGEPGDYGETSAAYLCKILDEQKEA